MSEIMTVAEVADELRVSSFVVRNLLQQGKLKGKRVAGDKRATWRIPRQSLIEFLATPDTDEPRTRASSKNSIQIKGRMLRLGENG